jgi:hypothetical protein
VGHAVSQVLRCWLAVHAIWLLLLPLCCHIQCSTFTCCAGGCCYSWGCSKVNGFRWCRVQQPWRLHSMLRLLLQLHLQMLLYVFLL